VGVEERKLAWKRRGEDRTQGPNQPNSHAPNHPNHIQHPTPIQTQKNQTWQYERYVTAAWRAGYAVREAAVGGRDESSVELYAARCVHGVPPDRIRAMAAQWQE